MSLIFRCPSCLGAGEVLLERLSKSARSARCARCAGVFPLPAGNTVELADPELPVRIAECAMVHQIDRASALSVLMEIWRAEAARAVLAPAKTSPRSGGRVPLKAMSVLALVALLAHAAWAFLLKSGASPAPQQVAPVRSEDRTASSPAPPSADHASYRPGPDREPAWRSASDPANAIEDFCRQPEYAGRLKPLYLAPGRPQNSGEVMGIVRDLAAGEDLVAVRIRLDRRTGRWRIGNGRDPVRFEGASSFDADKKIPLPPPLIEP
jgi:hypothetical protein